MKYSNRNDLFIFILFFVVRISSVYFIQTFYEADEYWQSLEVAHKLTFGYGYLTWEWKTGIRSYIYPFIFTALYKILDFLTLDTPFLLITLPRVFQATLSALSDLCFYKWCGTRKWTVFSVATSWFLYYMGSRTLINSFETSISTIALSMFPWSVKYKEENVNFLWLVGFICVIRPTAAIMWFPLCLYHLMFTKYNWFNLILTRYLPIGVSLLLISIGIDTFAHGSLLISAYEFLKFNVLQNGASFYGTLPWYWYMSFGLPAVLGVNIIPFILATLSILNNRNVYRNELIMLGTIVFTIAVLSILPHKEFRFTMPILPLIFYISSRYISLWSRTAKDLHVWIVAFIILIGNLIPGYYLGMVHQRGTLDVMTNLREIAHKDPINSNFLFLMPCHSTPMYSHLHVNVTTRYLTCNPNINNDSNYVDEVTQFYKDPNSWLRQNYPPNGTLPSHIITFDNLSPFINDILSRYKPIMNFFHTDVPVSNRIGRTVVVHELQF